jgi:hypothetical protein
MALKISTGISKKLGLPEYSSIGANCQVEFELDPSLLSSDLETFHEKIRAAYVACRQAVDDELARHRQKPAVVERQSEEPKPDRWTSNGSPVSTNGNGSASNGRAATDKQLMFINRLVGQIPGLDHQRLEALANKMFSNGVAQLTSLQASGLIDTLKGIKDGSIDVGAALGVPADG